MKNKKKLSAKVGIELNSNKQNVINGRKLNKEMDSEELNFQRGQAISDKLPSL